MNKSFWGIMVTMIGVASILFIVFFQTITNTDEHNSQMLKEVTEAAMWDSVDYAYLKVYGRYKINKEKFVENFVRRYAESANLSRNYTIQFYDVNELPPKVSIKVTSSSGSFNATTALPGGKSEEGFDISNKIDAILETPY